MQFDAEETPFQDEPSNGTGDGGISPDGQGVGSRTAEVRAERKGNGNGRYYHISRHEGDTPITMKIGWWITGHLAAYHSPFTIHHSPFTIRYFQNSFSASDSQGGSCTGTVKVSVPKNQGNNGAAVDDGPLYDSTQP